MAVIYRAVEVVVAVLTTGYSSNRTLHAEASFPSPDPTREWQVDNVTLQIFPGVVASGFNVMFYRGSTGLASNELLFPDTMLELGGLSVDGQVRLPIYENIVISNSTTRIYSFSPPRRISIFLDDGVYKFQTFTTAGITPTNAAAKFVIGLVSGG